MKMRSTLNFIQHARRDTLPRSVLVVLASAACIALAANAGSLTPSASPASTMSTLQNIYDSIAGTFDSSGIASSQNGSLIQALKYLNSNLGWASGSNNIWNLNSGNIGIGSTSPASKLDIAGDVSIRSTSRLGLNSAAVTTQTSMTTYGVFGSAYQGHTSGTISNVTGIEGDAYNTAGGDVTRLIGTAGYAEQSGAGTIANMASLWAFANLRSAGTVTNNYGLYIANQTAGSNNWGLYASGSNKNYFGGNVGVGTSNIDATFEVAGTASVSNLFIGPSSSSSQFGAVQLNVSVKVPSSPAATFTTSSTTGINDGLYVQGRYAYLTTAAGFQIIDISDPANPVAVGSITSQNNSFGIAVQGRYAYVASQGSNPRIKIYDVANPALPFLVGSISPSNFPWGSYVQGRYWYISNTDGTISIIDVANPASPVVVGTVPAIASCSNIIGLQVQGSYAYATCFETNAIYIINISNPASPYVVSSHSTDTQPARLAVQGRYAYVAHRSGNSFRIYDISNPASISYASTISAGTTARSVAVQGHYAYVTSSGSGTVQIYDVSVPATPVLVGTISGVTAAEVDVVSGRYLYVKGLNNAKLYVFDIGGSYIQQLEAGGIESSTLTLRNNLTVFNDTDIRGGAVIGRGLQITGPFSITSSISGYNTFRFNPEGGASLSAAFELGSYASLSTTLWVSPPGKSGNVGIGESSPTAKLELSGGTASLSNTLYVENAGNVGIGTTAPETKLHVMADTPADANLVYFSRASNDTTGAYIGLRKARGTHASFSDVQSGDILGGITSNARTGSVWRQTSSIEFLVDGGFVSGQRPPSAIQFYTNVANTASAERMRISANGNLGIGTTSNKYPLFLLDTTAESGTASASLGLRANSLTTGTVASLSATGLTGGGLVMRFTVPASTSAAAGYLLVKDTAGVAYASLGYGGRLALARDIRSDGATSTCTGVNTPSQGCIDYAENFPTDDTTLSAGDIVSAVAGPQQGRVGNVAKAIAGSVPVGIVSTNPAALITGTGLLSGSNTHEGITHCVPGQEDCFVPIALAGRVPVRFSNENGEVVPGDHLAVSTTKPGFAMKQTAPGMTIGIALESSAGASAEMSGRETVVTFVTTSYWAPHVPEAITANDTSLFERLLAYLRDAVVTVRELVAPRVRTDELQMRDSATGQTWCVRIVSGEFQKTPGECDANPSPEPSQQPVEPSTAPESSPDASAPAEPSASVEPAPTDSAAAPEEPPAPVAPSDVAPAP